MDQGVRRAPAADGRVPHEWVGEDLPVGVERGVAEPAASATEDEAELAAARPDLRVDAGELERVVGAVDVLVLLGEAKERGTSMGCRKSADSAVVPGCTACCAVLEWSGSSSAAGRC